MLKKSVFVCVNLWLIFFAFPFDSSAQTYSNPVIPGDFPDPSVIRVRDDFYATATSGGWSPHFPVLHSRDLINWKIVGAVLQAKPAWAKGDFWAAEMAQDKGKFYVFYTARRDEGKNKKGTLCVAVAVSDKPDRDFQDKGTLVCQEMGSIDAFFIRDENGKPFLIWKEDGNDRQKPTWLYAQELDETLTRLKGKPTKLFRNEGAGWENHVVEGSFIVRRGEWFYHFYSGNACCGRACNYALGVARSKTLLGKWEKNPANPILTANEAWQCPGHGSIVETADGRFFLLYHAYRKNSEAFNIGRETLLDEVKFENGWATINGGRGPSQTANAPLKNTVQIRPKTFLEEFSGSALAPFWQTPLFSDQTEKQTDGFLTIAPTVAQIAAEKTPESIVAERTVSGDYTATTRIDVSKMQTNESAGIAAYSWRGNAVGAGFGGGKVFAWRRENLKQTDSAGFELPKNVAAVYLKMTVRGGESFDFAWSADGENYAKIGETINGSYVEGARVALVYNGKTPNAGARFDFLKVEQK